MMEVYEPGYTSHSELESLSDSDWLDIASSRASGDTDSIVGFDDSDREDHHDRPPSRRSFNSLASSKDGVVDGWEGLVEDSADEGSVDHQVPSPDAPPSPSLADALQAALISPSGIQDDTDDELVKAGLEQSMMSTLSASRSNSLSGSMQTSIVRSRDLRLSFPDPITSSQGQSLNSSYENLSPVLDVPESDTHTNNAVPEATLAPKLDSAPVTESLALQKTGKEGDYSNVPSAITPDFSIVLYGLSALAKSPLLDILLEKWAIAAGLILSCNMTHAPGVMTRVFIASGGNQASNASRRFVSIIDKTGIGREDNVGPVATCPFYCDFIQFQSIDNPQPSCPSLAIVALPSFSKVQLPAHTIYLPVFMPDPLGMIDVFASTDHLLNAKQEWGTLRIPRSKLTSLSDWSSPVVDSEKLKDASPAQVHNAFKPLLPKPIRKPAKRSVSTNAITMYVGSLISDYSPLITLCSITVLGAMLGYVVHGSMYGVDITAKNVTNTIAMQTLGSYNTTFEEPVTLPPDVSFSNTGFAIASSSPHGLEAAAIESLTTAVATTSAVVRQPSVPSTSSLPHSDISRPPVSAPSECQCGCGLVTWPGKDSSKELSLRPSPSTSSLSLDTRTKALTFIVPPSKSDLKGKGKEKEISAHTAHDVSLSSLSTRIAGSIQEYFDFKTVMRLAKTDMQELLDAIDELVFAIRRQTASIWEQSKGTIEIVRNEFRYRNERAKQRASQLRQMGGRMLTNVKERIRTQTEHAKEDAKLIRETIGKNNRETRKLRRALRREARRIKKMQRKVSKKSKKLLAFE